MKKYLIFLLMFLMIFTTNVSAQNTNIVIDGKAVVFTESTGSQFADENSITQVIWCNCRLGASSSNSCCV